MRSLVMNDPCLAAEDQSNPRPPESGTTSRQGFLIGADQIVYGATNFVTTVLVARAAGFRELGFYTLGLGLALVSLDLQNSLVLIPYTLLNPHPGEGAQTSHAGSALLHSLVLGSLAMGGLVLLGCLAPLGIRPLGSGTACWALALAVPPLFLRQHARAACFAQFQITRALALDLAVASLQLAGLGLLATQHTLHTAAGVYGVIALACALGGVLWLAPRRRVLRVRPERALADFLGHWPFAKWLAGTTPIAVIRYQLPIWLLAFTHGAGAAGLFAACLGITALAGLFLSGVAGTLCGSGRSLHGTGAPALRRFMLPPTAVTAGAMILFFLVFVRFGDRLAITIYGAHDVVLGLPLAILAIAALAGSSCGFRPAPWRAEIALSTEVVMLLVHATLGFGLVLRYGLNGAALAMLAGNLAGLAFQRAVYGWAERSGVGAMEEFG